MFWPQGWDNTMLTRGFFREVSQADGNRSSMTGVVRTLGKSCWHGNVTEIIHGKSSKWFMVTYTMMYGDLWWFILWCMTSNIIFPANRVKECDPCSQRPQRKQWQFQHLGIVQKQRNRGYHLDWFKLIAWVSTATLANEFQSIGYFLAPHVLLSMILASWAPNGPAHPLGQETVLTTFPIVPHEFSHNPPIPSPVPAWGVLRGHERQVDPNPPPDARAVQSSDKPRPGGVQGMWQTCSEQKRAPHRCRSWCWYMAMIQLFFSIIYSQWGLWTNLSLEKEHLWLVVYLSEKYEFVSWNDYSQSMEK